MHTVAMQETGVTRGQSSSSCRGRCPWLNKCLGHICPQTGTVRAESTPPIPRASPLTGEMGLAHLSMPMLTCLHPPEHTHLSTFTCPHTPTRTHLSMLISPHLAAHTYPHGSHRTHPPVLPFLVLPGPANLLSALDSCPFSLSLTLGPTVFGLVGSSGPHRPAGPNPLCSRVPTWSTPQPGSSTSQPYQASFSSFSSHTRSLSIQTLSTPGPRPVPPHPHPTSYLS